MPKSAFIEYMRCRVESAFEDNQTTPATSVKDWNLGGGAGGWIDLPVIQDNPGLQPKSTQIYPALKAGVRAMNTSLPVAGAYGTELGSLDMPVFPELIDRPLYAIFGAVNRTLSAGTAALASTAFGSLAALDTQPTGAEQLRFTISGSTAATGAAINILVDGEVVETITIGTSGSNVNGVYWSKGGYAATVTLTIAGTVTSGMVVVAGFQYSTNVFTQGAISPTLQMEQAGRPEAGTGNSEYFSGIVIPTLGLSYDRAALDSLLMANLTIQGLPPLKAAAGSYKNDASAYYRPLASWTGAVEIDGVSYAEVVSANFTLQSNDAMTATSSGHQKPTGHVAGQWEMFGTMTILPDSDARWNDYLGATARNVVFNFVSPYMVNATTPYSFKIQMSQLTFGDYGRNRNGAALGAELSFRGIFNEADAGSVKVTTVGRMPT